LAIVLNKKGNYKGN